MSNPHCDVVVRNAQRQFAESGSWSKSENSDVYTSIVHDLTKHPLCSESEPQHIINVAKLLHKIMDRTKLDNYIISQK